MGIVAGVHLEHAAIDVANRVARRMVVVGIRLEIADGDRVNATARIGPYAG